MKKGAVVEVDDMGGVEYVGIADVVHTEKENALDLQGQLYQACKAGDIKKTATLLASGQVDPSYTYEDYHTPMALAMLHGHTATAILINSYIGGKVWLSLAIRDNELMINGNGCMWEGGTRIILGQGQHPGDAVAQWIANEYTQTGVPYPEKSEFNVCVSGYSGSVDSNIQELWKITSEILDAAIRRICNRTGKRSHPDYQAENLVLGCSPGKKLCNGVDNFGMND